MGDVYLDAAFKAECAGRGLVEVNPNGTSQECSSCGNETPKTLAERFHKCCICGLSIDRDLNAARNILKRAGVGPGPHNAAEKGTRAGGSIDESGTEPISRGFSSRHSQKLPKL